MRLPLLLSLALLLAVPAASCGGSSGSPSDARGADGDSTAPTADALPDAPEEVAPDLPSGDLPLPFLPPEKVFATRYAAGAASRDITPDKEGVYMGGFGFCAGKPSACKVSEGIHDPLMLGAAALADTETGEVVIFVGIDSVGLIKADIVAIQEAIPAAFADAYGVQLAGERVVIGASHSHSTPDTVGLWGPMLDEQREEEEYIAFLRQAVVDAALEAYGNLGDATLDWGTGSAPSHSDDASVEDETVFVLRARRPEGDTVFTLTRWPSHPTVYWYDTNALSADWVGPFRKKMEEEVGGVAVYLNGPIGSVYPDDVTPCEAEDAFPDGFKDPDLSAEDFAMAACIGYNVADQALAGLATGSPVEETGLRFRFAEFEFHPTNFALAAILSLSAIPWDPIDTADPESMMVTRLSWISLGDVELLTVPGEAFPSFAAHAVQLLVAAGFENAFVLGPCQDWMGYLLAEDQWDQEDLSYHRSISPGPAVEAAYLERLQKLVDGE